MGFLNFTALCIFGEGYPGARSSARIAELRGWAGDSESAISRSLETRALDLRCRRFQDATQEEASRKWCV